MNVFENNKIYTLIKPFFNRQPMYCFKFFLRLFSTFHVLFHSTADINGRIYSVKVEFCFPTLERLGYHAQQALSKYSK